MSVKHLFLAILSQKDMYGYEIKSNYDRALAIAQMLNLGQIYSTIGRLERDEYISQIENTDVDKKVYSITDKGRAELNRWLSETDVWNNYTDTISYKIAAAKYLDLDALLECITEYRVHLISTLQDLTRQERVLQDDNPGVSLVFERNILRLDADIKWLDSCIEKILQMKTEGKHFD